MVLIDLGNLLEKTVRLRQLISGDIVAGFPVHFLVVTLKKVHGR
jgi:hypothetical protein